MEVSLYKPERYPVVIGSGSAALCIGWSDTSLLQDAVPGLLEHAGIIGSLYSPNGIHAVLRNLALNPGLRTLYIWRNEELSRTVFGIIATDTLIRLLKEGVNEKGELANSNFILEEEFDRSVFEMIRKMVTVEIIDDIPKEKLPEVMHSADTTGPYMEPSTFPDPPEKPVDTFPSERYAFSFHGNTIIATWTQVIDAIMRYGYIRDLGVKTKELLNVSWCIYAQDPGDVSFPFGNPGVEFRKTTGATNEAIERYKQIFISPRKGDNIAYTYGERLRAYRGKVNQIENIIQMLKKDPNVRQACVQTYLPDSDFTLTSPPCLVFLQFLIDDTNTLQLIANFRSHDMLKAAIPNAYGLVAVHSEVATAIGVNRGALIINSQNAHIYEEDWEEAKKYIHCTIRERTSAELTTDDLDPRGGFIITITNGGDATCTPKSCDTDPPDTTDTHMPEAGICGPETDSASKKIEVRMVSLTSDQLIAFEGTNAEEIIEQIGRLRLVSQPHHALYIGAELKKAEIALRLNKQYTQDRDLTL